MVEEEKAEILMPKVYAQAKAGVSQHSVLFRSAAKSTLKKQLGAPDFFTDLNLDQIISAVTQGKEEYDLMPFFYTPLRDIDAVMYRHEILHDLETPQLLDSLKAFAESMRNVRVQLDQTEKGYYQRQIERWFLDAVNTYLMAVTRLARDLSASPLQSRGLRAINEYVSQYTTSKPFTSLLEQSERLTTELSELRYEILIQGLRVEVRKYENESNYSTEIEGIFERFSQGKNQEYTYGFNDSPTMNQVEGRILERVALLYDDTFSKLTSHRTVHKNFLDPTLVSFDREMQFYVAYLEYITKFESSGLHFCYPCVSRTDKEIQANESFDLALAAKLSRNGAVPVTNDFYLKGPERIIVVSGPNQGGKTTFARTFGQLHYLASLGLSVPGTKAQLYLPDALFTHFEREEKMTDLRGKLEDDLVRIHDILEVATPRSIVIVNEIFTSTTLQDALALSKKIAETIMKLDAVCVWITFIDEVASLGKKTVSMSSTVKPNNPAVRTFKVVRRPTDGLAYAISIAEKHKLTYDMIKRRIT